MYKGTHTHTEREREREREKEREKFEKELSSKVSLENSFYLIHFSCGLALDHHIKLKLKFKSQKSENKQICCGT